MAKGLLIRVKKSAYNRSAVLAVGPRARRSISPYPYRDELADARHHGEHIVYAKKNLFPSRSIVLRSLLTE